MGILKNLWQGSKDSLEAFGLRLKALKVSFTNFQTALANLQQAVNTLSTLSHQVEAETRKLKFKNQPHLERIDEAKERIDTNLTKINSLLHPMKKH